MARSTEVKAVPLLYAGPFPPPAHGQSLCTQVLAERLAAHGVPLVRIDLNAAGAKPLSRLLSKLGRHLRLAFAAQDASCVYISANSNAGMWLTAAAAGVLRIRGKRLLIHHHAYDHVRRRRASMVALARAAGPRATHIVLGAGMARQLRLNTPEAENTFVLNNAGLVDDTLLGLRSSAAGLCLGHLSNLSGEKGIAEVVDLAIRLNRSGTPARLVVAGPATDEAARAAIARAREALGSAFTCLGPVSGGQKRDFFTRITHFVLPTRYRNEASPLVLLEAMAAGIPCIATDIGCIADDIGAGGGLVIPLADDFVATAARYLSEAHPAPDARARFSELRQAHEAQLSGLIALVAPRHPIPAWQ
ncbi:glycosyltransferase family 4 protein [Devosia ginsengisoli]|nr:glycosyltransferase family 4 protein [Devosia ginsengisoli]